GWCIVVRVPSPYTLFPYPTLFRFSTADSQKLSSHQPARLSSANTGRVSSSHGFQMAAAWRRTSAVPSSIASHWLRLRSTTSSRRSGEHTSELQSREHLVCRLLLE